MIGAPMLFLSIILAKLGYVPEMGRGDGVLSVLYIGGWMCTALGLRKLRVTGQGNLGAAVSIIQILALTLALVWSLLIALNPQVDRNTLLFRVTDVAWPFSHAYMLVVGIAC
jgi:hypothetical protein